MSARRTRFLGGDGHARPRPGEVLALVCGVIDRITFALAYRYYHDKQLLDSNLIDQPIPDTAKLYLVTVRMPAQL